MHALTAASTATFAVNGAGFLDRRSSSSTARLRRVRTLASFALACGLAFGASIAHAAVAGWETASSSRGASQSEVARSSLAQPQVRWLLARFIVQARSIPADAHGLSHERSEVDVSSIASDGEGRFEVGWTETHYAGDTRVAVEYWHALLEVGAPSEALAAGNPFDFYVRNIVWSRYD